MGLGQSKSEAEVAAAEAGRRHLFEVRMLRQATVAADNKVIQIVPKQGDAHGIVKRASLIQAQQQQQQQQASPLMPAFTLGLNAAETASKRSHESEAKYVEPTQPEYHYHQPTTLVPVPNTGLVVPTPWPIYDPLILPQSLEDQQLAWHAQQKQQQQLSHAQRLNTLKTAAERAVESNRHHHYHQVIPLSQLHAHDLPSDPTPSIEQLLNSFQAPACILPHIYLGSYQHVFGPHATLHHKRQQLKHLHIRYILNATNECANMFANNFIYEQLPLEDNDSCDLLAYVDESISFIRRAVERQQNILIHSNKGQSRCAAVLIAYLMTQQQHTLQEALLLIQATLPRAQPKPYLMEQLRQLEQQLHPQHDLTAAVQH